MHIFFPSRVAKNIVLFTSFSFFYFSSFLFFARQTWRVQSPMTST